MGVLDGGKKSAEKTAKTMREAEARARAAKNAAKIAQARAGAAKREISKTETGKRIASFQTKARQGVRPSGPAPTMMGAAGVPRIIARHTVKKGETLSAIAKKYYGSGAKKYYELIQSANKDLIKDVNLIYPDQIFKIPELPPELKK